jgi:hypothetical protein
MEKCAGSMPGSGSGWGKISSSILHGYFNPLVFWYQWEYLLTIKEFNFFAGYLGLAMYEH